MFTLCYVKCWVKLMFTLCNVKWEHGFLFQFCYYSSFQQWGRLRKFLWPSHKSWTLKEQTQIPAKLIRIDWYGINAKKGKKVLTNDPEYCIGENIISLIFILFRSSDVSNQSWIYNFQFFSWKWVCSFSTCWKLFFVK